MPTRPAGRFAVTGGAGGLGPHPPVTDSEKRAMKHTPALGACLALLLGLAACGSGEGETPARPDAASSEPAEPTPPAETAPGTAGPTPPPNEGREDQQHPTSTPQEPAEIPPDLAVCQEFFDGPGPLAGRVDDAQDQVSAGEWDALSYGEVNLLSQRLSQLSDRSVEPAAVIDRMNAPFLEITASYQEGGGDDRYADLGTTDPADSRDALEEFLDFCTAL